MYLLLNFVFKGTFKIEQKSLIFHESGLKTMIEYNGKCNNLIIFKMIRFGLCAKTRFFINYLMLENLLKIELNEIISVFVENHLNYFFFKLVEKTNSE